MTWQTSGTSVVILGAGFSAAATEGRMPLMKGFFDRLNGSDCPLLHELVTVVAGQPELANVESVLLALDQFKTSPDLVLEGWADKWKRNLKEVHRELAEYTLARLKPALDIDSDNWAVQLLGNAGTGTTVISMNYDNIADRVLSCRKTVRHGDHGTCPHCKMGWLLKKACSCTGRNTDLSESEWRGTLIKPHGSIAWRRCLNPSCCSFDCLVADCRCEPFKPTKCPNCRGACGPVMVMPTMSKSLEDVKEIGIMWKAARMAIEVAESVLLFGFSMPESDELLMQMVRASIHKNRRLQRVTVIDLEPEPIVKRFKRCIPDDLDVQACTFAVERGTQPAWFELVPVPWSVCG